MRLQTIINEEQQYYLQDIDLAADSRLIDPLRVENGILKIDCIRTPDFYEDHALGVIDSYDVVSIVNSNSFRVRGRGYFDRNLAAATTRPGSSENTFILNGSAGGNFVGVNNYLRDNVNGDDPGTPGVNSDFYKKEYDYVFIRLQNGTTTRYISIENNRVPRGTSATVPNVDVLITLQAGQPMPQLGESITLLRRMPYVSGMLSTRGALNGSQMYGSWHMRVKLPDGKGAFGAVWSWPSYTVEEDAMFGPEQKDVEIDFIEQLGHTDIQYHNAHQPQVGLADFFSSNDRIFNSNNTDGMGLPDVSNPNNISGLRGTIEGQFSRQTLEGPEWSGNTIQQHQVRLREGQLDFAREWQEVIWDWYPDNTCVWFVKVGDVFREIAHANMSPTANDGDIDPRLIFINNAFDSQFNRTQEVNDAPNRPIRDRTPEPWTIELDFIRVYNWTGSNDGGGNPGTGGAPTLSVVSAGREQGAAHVVFHKPVGMGLHEMGVKQKTFDALRKFRAGIEGNISELKRSFGMARADWKGRDGFDAFVLSSVLTFNLVRFVRIDSG